MLEQFKKWTSVEKTKNGWHCKCKKGLFTVHAPTLEEAEKEAFYYFRQYFADGEYIEGMTKKEAFRKAIQKLRDICY